MEGDRGMNVVCIVLDTTRRDKIAPFNPDVDFTENISAFAEDATVFTDAVAQSSWTLPSHASMFTGQYPWEHEATQEHLSLDTQVETLAEKFSNAGYRTACYTSNAWVSPQMGMTDGFDEVDNFFPFLPMDKLRGVLKKFWDLLGSNRNRIGLIKYMEKFGAKIHTFAEKGGSKTPKIMEKSMDFTESDEDFFLFINLMDAHYPLYPEEPYKSRHAPEVDLSDLIHANVKHNAGKKDADFEQIEKVYEAEVDYMDDQVGRLLDHIEEANLAEDTVVCIVADHGEHLGEHGLAGHVCSVSEELVSVPLIIRAPGEGKDMIEKQVELRELYHMLPAYAGIEEQYECGTEYAYGGLAYPRMHLANLPDERREVLGKERVFIRTGDRKLTKSIRNGVEEYEMKDLETGELCEVDDELVTRLENSRMTFEDAGDEEDIEPEDEQVRDRLKDLGYIS